MAKCNDAMHGRAVAALKGLSQTQFGRAALERHGHTPLSIEEAREGNVPDNEAAEVKGPKSVA